MKFILIFKCFLSILRLNVKKNSQYESFYRYFKITDYALISSTESITIWPL